MPGASENLGLRSNSNSIGTQEHYIYLMVINFRGIKFSRELIFAGTNFPDLAKFAKIISREIFEIRKFAKISSREN